MGGSEEKQESSLEEVPRISSGTPYRVLYVPLLLDSEPPQPSRALPTGPKATKLLQALKQHSRGPEGRK